MYAIIVIHNAYYTLSMRILILILNFDFNATKCLKGRFLVCTKKLKKQKTKNQKPKTKISKRGVHLVLNS